MLLKRASTLIVAAALVAMPATAFADGAGDNQYQDPLSAPSTPKKAKTKQTTAPAAATPATTPATSTPAAATSPAASSGTAATPAAAQLPRTGTPAALIGLAGALMLACGLALRRHTASS